MRSTRKRAAGGNPAALSIIPPSLSLYKESFILPQRVQRRPCLEPPNLLRRHAVIGLDLHVLSVRLANRHLHWFPRGERCEPGYAHTVFLFELVVVRGVGEGQGQDALFL